MRSERFGNPGVRLRGTRPNSYFCPIVASFVRCYSLILGPDAIRTFREPRGPVTGYSSKLAVLAYSGQFCMLLLTDFGSWCDPNILGTPRSYHVELAVFAYSCQLSMLLLTDFGSRCDTNISGTLWSGLVDLVKTRSFGLSRPVFYAICH